MIYKDIRQCESTLCRLQKTLEIFTIITNNHTGIHTIPRYIKISTEQNYMKQKPIESMKTAFFGTLKETSNNTTPLPPRITFFYTAAAYSDEY